MGFDQLVSLISLALAIFFWWNARQQAASAERTLDQIKSQIIGWQDQLNKTAVDMLASRPEMIARQATLSESESAASFSGKMAQRLGHPLSQGEKWMSRFIAVHCPHDSTKNRLFSSPETHICSGRAAVTRCRVPASMRECPAGRATRAKHPRGPVARRRTQGADGASVARRAGWAG